jgi:hypothetical protein
MKIIKNETNQGFEIYLKTNEGQTAVWLKPKEKLVVEDTAITEQLVVLGKRKLIRIINA